MNRWFSPHVTSREDLATAAAREASRDWGAQHRFHPPYALTSFEVAMPPDAWPPHFALVSGYATTSETWSDNQNRQANARLLAALHACGCWHHPVTGVSPDGSEREPGWAVALPLTEAAQFGAQFRQDAIYWIEHDALAVHGCESGEARHAPLDGFLQRVVSLTPEAFTR